MEESLLKIKFQYKDNNDNSLEIRIYATNEILKNLNNQDIEQFFMDGTYKIVPNFGDFKSLVTLLGFNKKANSFVQCCYTLLTDETQNIYENFLRLLKLNYQFKT